MLWTFTGDSNKHPQYMILWRNIETSLFIILIPIPDFPHSYYMLGANLGSLLYRNVFVISISLKGVLGQIMWLFYNH